MNKIEHATTAADRYDRALSRGSKRLPLPTGCPSPQPTAAWPPENVELLERYRNWLEMGSAAKSVIEQHRIPMAGHVLGLALKPHPQLDLTTDLEKAMAYVEAKQPSQMWLRNCRYSLKWFRRFLRLERGLVTAEISLSFADVRRYQVGLPDWLLVQLEQYLHIRQANWRPSRLLIMTYQYWQQYTHLWRWLFVSQLIGGLPDIKRQHLFSYMDEMLTKGYAPSTVNQYLYSFQAMLRFLQGRGFQITAALLNVSGLKQPDRLPRFLTDAQVALVREDLEQRVLQADTHARIRNSLLDRAAFYLLWQSGLRVGELEDLSLSDLDISNRRLIVRWGKGLKDRTVYLTEITAAALESYLEVRGPGNDDNVFLHRYRPLCKDLVRDRIKASGKRVGVKVSPHRLRHTFATQLVNAGCRVTTIQSLLGHRRLNSTMIYARVHDQTVADDYYAAMAVIEERLESYLQPITDQTPGANGCNPDTNGTANHLLRLVATLQAEPLTASQQAVVSEIHGGLASLAKSLNGTQKKINNFVNEQTANPHLLVGM